MRPLLAAVAAVLGLAPAALGVKTVGAAPAFAPSAAEATQAENSFPPTPAGVPLGAAAFASGSAENDVLDSAAGRMAARLVRATSWNGGTYTTSNGQRITIYVHDRYVFDPARVQASAEWLSSFLYYADELPRATFYRAPPEIVASFCGPGAYGCYDPNSASLFVPGNRLPDGTHWMTVTAHEYGHHVAWSRANPPWQAGLFGPKRWASYARVCPRVGAGEALPDGRGGLYWSDPGEIFAETYAKVVNRDGNWVDNWWPAWGWNYDPTFQPDYNTIAAAQHDATTPYAGPSVETWSGRLTRKKVRVKRKGKWRLVARGPVLPKTFDLYTEVDGDFHGVLDISPGATLAVVDAATGALVASPGPAVSFTICGQRELRLRVVSSRPGPFRVSITYP